MSAVRGQAGAHVSATVVPLRVSFARRRCAPRNPVKLLRSAQILLTSRPLGCGRNQGTLREDVELFAAEQKANGFKDTKISQSQTVDADHGRIETKIYTVFHDVAWLQERHDWPELKGIVMVESKREIPGATPEADKMQQETLHAARTCQACG